MGQVCTAATPVPEPTALPSPQEANSPPGSNPPAKPKHHLSLVALRIATEWMERAGSTALEDWATCLSIPHSPPSFIPHVLTGVAYPQTGNRHLLCTMYLRGSNRWLPCPLSPTEGPALTLRPHSPSSAPTWDTTMKNMKTEQSEGGALNPFPNVPGRLLESLTPLSPATPSLSRGTPARALPS